MHSRRQRGRTGALLKTAYRGGPSSIIRPLTLKSVRKQQGIDATVAVALLLAEASSRLAVKIKSRGQRIICVFGTAALKFSDSQMHLKKSRSLATSPGAAV